MRRPRSVVGDGQAARMEHATGLQRTSTVTRRKHFGWKTLPRMPSKLDISRGCTSRATRFNFFSNVDALAFQLILSFLSGVLRGTSQSRLPIQVKLQVPTTPVSSTCCGQHACILDARHFVELHVVFATSFLLRENRVVLERWWFEIMASHGIIVPPSDWRNAVRELASRQQNLPHLQGQQSWFLPPNFLAMLVASNGPNIRIHA
jgi:hypothetical protein